LSEIKLINKTPTSIYYDSGHVKCQHAMRTHKSLSTVGQKECIINFTQFSLILQIFKEISTLTDLFFSISKTYIAKEEFVFYLAEGNWNFNPFCPIHHVVFDISFRPRSSKVPLPFRVSD